VILDNATGTGNDTPPSYPISQLANVGLISGQGTGIYLGNYGGQFWVLTANHVNMNDINLGGTLYNAVAGSYVQLANPDTSPTDLGVFRISADPGLSNLNLNTTTPTVGLSVYMEGFGYNRDTGLETWDASWTLGGTPTAHSGYSYGTTGFTDRWGPTTWRETF